jgi:hypothetical protein
MTASKEVELINITYAYNIKDWGKLMKSDKRQIIHFIKLYITRYEISEYMCPQ